jgi:MFS family permease
VRDTPALRSLFMVFLPVFALFGFQNSLLLPFSTQALGANEFQYGLIEGLSMSGFVGGALVMASLADRLHEGQWIATSIIGMALAGIVYSQLASVPLAIGVGLFSAFMNAPSYIGRILLIQRNTPREVRGRVNSAFFVTRNIVFVFGMAAAGLADVFNVRVLFLISALLLLGAGILGLVLPGLGQPTAEWRRVLTMLRSASNAPGLGLGPRCPGSRHRPAFGSSAAAGRAEPEDAPGAGARGSRLRSAGRHGSGAAGRGQRCGLLLARRADRGEPHRGRIRAGAGSA